MVDAKVWGSKQESSSAAKAADSSKCKCRWKVLIRSEGRGLFPEKREEEKEKRELRSPDGTEPDIGDGVVRVVVAALRATAVVGGAVPVAAAQQTRRTSRGSCGVCHAS